MSLGPTPYWRSHAKKCQDRSSALSRTSLLGHSRSDSSQGKFVNWDNYDTVLITKVSFKIQAACSNDPAIAKTSVEILRSIISHVLQEQPEPRHFHFNEALFKPFEHLLCRENFDADLQDQVLLAVM